MKKLTTLFLLAPLFYTPANAQYHVQRIDTLFMIYQSEPGTRPAAGLQSAQGGMSGFSDRLDATGDGKPELILTSEDPDGNLLDLLVIDGTSLFMLPDSVVYIQDVPQTLGLAERDGMKFFGFGDVDGDDTNEVIFGNGRDVWLVDPSDNTVEWVYTASLPAGTFIPSDFPVLLTGVTDITDDRFPDLILFLPQTKQVEVWGNPQ